MGLIFKNHVPLKDKLWTDAIIYATILSYFTSVGKYALDTGNKREVSSRGKAGKGGDTCNYSYPGGLEHFGIYCDRGLWFKFGQQPYDTYGGDV